MKKTKAQPARNGLRKSATTKRIAIGVVAVLAAGAFWMTNQSDRSGNNGQPNSSAASAQTGRFPFKVVKPGPGDMAPPVRLTSTEGTPFDLEALRGKTVLLYFQEGLMCEACWVQLREIEANFSRFREAGIDAMATITTDPPDLLARKVRSERLLLPVLADPSVAVSQTYRTNGDGMMNGSYNAHTFVIVGADGRIRWRADYGGAPSYNMYVPVPDLLADIGRGLAAAPGQAAP
ncbi:MAG: redoxin domain-containing protein [Rhizobiales bacterium]|nr:redoxin domain-containing protein [Hyphomicrobiales bacterium]MBI3671861.1 redoxin domain-containing protein [Hyphomicrobiales bacterium]